FSSRSRHTRFSRDWSSDVCSSDLADLDGDGMFELSMHAWNNFAFTNAAVTGADTYVYPEDGAENIFLQASGNDDLSWFNGVVVDINGDGDDEIFTRANTGTRARRTAICKNTSAVLT